jgi:hypothetical protein
MKDTKYQRIIADAEQEAIEKHEGCLRSLDGQPTPSLVPTQIHKGENNLSQFP